MGEYGLNTPVVLITHPIGMSGVWTWHAEMALRRLVQIEAAIFEVRRVYLMNLIREHLD